LAFPDGIATIESYTCGCCSGLTSVTETSDRAFEGCSRLIDVAVPASMTASGKQAFQHCSRLLSNDILSSVTKLG
jgi:hypothetical protein